MIEGLFFFVVVKMKKKIDIFLILCPVQNVFSENIGVWISNGI